MDIIIISLAAFFTAILTFYSGFGLGTILTPVFVIFFPVDIAIALSGVVHFINNLFKIMLVGKNADPVVLIKFGIPAIIASFGGAWLLFRLSALPVIASYQMNHHLHFITPVKLTIALLLVIFSVTEIVPSFKKLSFGKDKLVLGGLLSGFFGGLSGIQGAIRSAFLIRSGLSKETFIATGVVIACLVDFTRLSVYTTKLLAGNLQDNKTILIVASVAAVSGAFIGNKLLKKVTFRFVRMFVTIMLILISIVLGTGLI